MHRLVLQTLVSLKFPEHSIPPFSACCIIWRYLTFVPFPHVTLQSDHSPWFCHLQSTFKDTSLIIRYLLNFDWAEIYLRGVTKWTILIAFLTFLLGCSCSSYYATRQCCGGLCYCVCSTKLAKIIRFDMLKLCVVIESSKLCLVRRIS